MDDGLTAYRAALDALFARTTGAVKFGLERVERFLELLGAPHRGLPAFHVAGTNGKGSVCATLAALLRGRGLRVGLYTSPHLVDFRERILVDGEPIAEVAVVEFLDRWAAAIDALGVSFFEATTAMAFDAFARAAVDVAVVETGLGGRLDATNVLSPLVSGVTSIGLDHTEYLGSTLEGIAAEKAGIFKAGAPAVIGERDARVRRLLAERGAARGARPVIVAAERVVVREVEVARDGTRFTMRGGDRELRLRTPLVGLHQAWNTTTALCMVDAAGAAYQAPVGDIARRLETVRLPGRFQRAGRFIFDVAHNPDGATVLADTLRRTAPERPVVALLGVLRDKDWRGVMRALAPAVDELRLVQPPSAPTERRWDVREAEAFARASGWRASGAVEFDAALRRASEDGATVLVTGSFHTVGDAMVRLQVDPLAG